MDTSPLKNIINQLLQMPKGLLAADESTKTIQKRFEKVGLESNPDVNLAYRKMLFTTPGAEEFLSGIILFDETIRQAIDGIAIPEYLANKGIIPGIKVDKGAIAMPNSPDEKITEGLDGLEERLDEYKQMGAKFTKWRSVIKIGDGIPTDNCLKENGEILAKYAKLVQEMGMVPIIEPEVIRDGTYDLEKCKEVTSKMLKAVFEMIKEHKVVLEGLILKPNMVTCGEDNQNQATPEDVAKATIDALLESVPKEVPGIVFLSGGQAPDMATENLNAICKLGGPWILSFSFARALQSEALEIWLGKEENIEAAQKAFYERGKKVSRARSARAFSVALRGARRARQGKL